MSDIVRLQPVHGKFVLILNGVKKVGIWMVDPDTGKLGTPVKKADAMKLLKMHKTLVRPAIIKNDKGKLVQWFTKDELAEIYDAKIAEVDDEEVETIFDEEETESKKETKTSQKKNTKKQEELDEELDAIKTELE